MIGMRVFAAAAALVGLLSLSPSAIAQGQNISGEWSTNAEVYGGMGMSLRQEGSLVTGTYNTGGLPGKIQGTMEGNVLRGTFSDIMVSGQIVLEFSPDGARFEGFYAVGGPNASGRRRWSGVRKGGVAAAPQDVIEARADLVRVAQSGASPADQATTACTNFVTSTFSYDKPSDTSRTRMALPQGAAFAQPLGVTQPGVLYLEIGGMGREPPVVANIGDAERRNGWQLRVSVNFTARSFQIAEQPNGRNWKNYQGAFLACTYYVRNNRPGIAFEVPMMRQLMVELPPVNRWSRP